MTRRDPFVNYTPANLSQNVPSRRTSRTSNGEMPQDKAEQEDRPSRQQRNNAPVDTTASDLADLQTVKRVLDVLKEGGMGVAGFLDALFWGNELAIADPTTRSARTSLTHSDRLAGIVSRWLSPPRTSQGGSTAGGARRVLLPVIINTVKSIIKKEMDALVNELKEDSADVTEQSVLGTVIDEVQEKVQATAPVFYDLVKTAAWSEEQDKRNTLKDPTKVGSYEFGSQQIIETNP